MAMSKLFVAEGPDGPKTISTNGAEMMFLVARSDAVRE
jgi:hypothetical protein